MQKGKIDMSKVSDEALVAALISCGTMKAAAASVGLTERAVFDRMKDRDFKAIYQQAKTDVIREAVFKILIFISTCEHFRKLPFFSGKTGLFKRGYHEQKISII